MSQFPATAIAAVAPAILGARLVLSLETDAQHHRAASVCAFAWGAIGAALLSLLSELGIARVLIGAFGDREGTALTIGIGAPGIEECAKGLALFAPLWFLRRDVSSVAGGAIQGALIGLGFATSENVIFFALSRSDVGTVREMSEVFLIRSVLDVAGHAAYTATTGAILGWARSRRRFISLADAMLALGLAVLLHVLWNCGSLMLAQAVDSSASKNDSAALQTIVQCTLPNGSSYQLVGWCP